ncbi:MAG TPA: hypothetical protein VHF67_05580, partial [Gaiellaceae bacterium]|nr:hypothetical protein [Gaiellaceae bacterium]
MLVELPQPFDFALSIERFRAFGADPMNLWEEGRLYRVFDGAEVQIAPAPNGVLVEPSRPALAAHVRRFLGASFDLDDFAGFA